MCLPIQLDIMFKNVNKVIKAYIYWDLVINSAWGLLAPIFAIFLLENIVEGNVFEAARVAGFGTFSYWFTKAVLQIPIANYLDKNHGEKDDFWFFVIGTLITGFVPFGFLLANDPWHIYTLNMFHAIGMSMIIPSSYAIFIRHTDKGKEAYESALDNTLFGIGIGVMGAVGGLLVAYVGFTPIFIVVGTLTLVSVFILFMVKKDMLPKVPRNVHGFPIIKEGSEIS